MAVDPTVLTRIMGANAPAASTRNNRLTQMLAGAGAAMSQVSRPGMGPGASFGEVLGAGAMGMLQGQQSAQQQERQAQLMQMREMQMQQQRQEMERRTRQQEMLQRMIGGTEARLERNPLAMEGGPQFQMQPGQESMVGNLPPQARQLLAAMAPEQQMQYLVQNSALAPRVEMLSSEEVEGLGLPEGSLVQRDPRNGSLQVLREGFDTDAAHRSAQIEAQYRPPRALSSTEQQLALLEAAGVDPQTRLEIAGKMRVTSTDPVTRETSVMNLATGERITRDEGEPTPIAASPDTDFTAGDISEAVGTEGFLKNIVNTMADAVGIDVPYKNQQSGERAIEMTRNSLRTILASELGGRPSNYTLEHIDKLLVPSNSPTTGPGASLSGFKQLQQMVRTRKQQAQGVISGTTGRYTPTQQAEAAELLLGMEAVDQQITDFMRNWNSGAPATYNAPGNQAQRLEEANTPAPEGVDAELWKELTPEERALWP